MLVAICQIGGGTFAIPTSAIRRILRMPRLTPVPDSSQELAGLFSVQGTIWPVVDPRSRLGFSTVPVNPDQRLILISVNTDYALWVDGVDRIETIASEQIATGDGPPNGRAAFAVAQVGGLIVPILSVEAFSPAELTQLALGPAQ